METWPRAAACRSLDDALDALDGAAPAVARRYPVVVTFDDGTADFAELAHPVLERHGIPATIYVATDFVDRGVDFPNDGPPAVVVRAARHGGRPAWSRSDPTRTRTRCSTACPPPGRQTSSTAPTR
jgi:hypothetical protein